MTAYTIYTIGHSTRSIEEFVNILKFYKIEYLIDVRRWPSSSRNPQYNCDALEQSLIKSKINYVWLGESLGGYRKLTDKEFKKHQPGKCLRSSGFRHYAAYMKTEEFQKGFNRLLKLSRQRVTAIMCAEKLYFKCHRMLISDKLKSIGVKVIHIIDKDHVVNHSYSTCAKIENGELIYI